MTNLEQNKEKIEALFQVSFEVRVLDEKLEALRSSYRENRDEKIYEELTANNEKLEEMKDKEYELSQELNTNHNISTQFIMKNNR